MLVIWLVLLAACKPTMTPPHHQQYPTGTQPDTSVIPSTKKAITLFVVTAADNPGIVASDTYAVITLDSIKISFDQNADLSHIVPTIQYFGQSVTPASKEPVDCDSAVLYTVTATDGTTFRYRLAVSRN